MEDSYTVHRRRKAAARRREKTPEPPRREEDSGEDDTVARAKMERMVEDTENMADDVVTKLEVLQPGEKTSSRPREKKSDEKVPQPATLIKKQPDLLSQSRTEAHEEPQEVVPVPASDPVIKTVQKSDRNNDDQLAKFSPGLDSGSEPRDTDVPSKSTSFKPSEFHAETENALSVDCPKSSASVIDTMPKQPPVHEPREPSSAIVHKTDHDRQEKMAVSQDGETRQKKRSKEKLPEKQSYATDSSDEDVKVKQLSRRRKSVEGLRTKTNVVKTQTHSRSAPHDSDDDRTPPDAEPRMRPSREKRRPSKHRYSTGTEDESAPKKGESASEKQGHNVPPDATNEGRAQQQSKEAKSKLREKRSVSRHRYPSDTDEDVGLKKSETFPQKSGDRQMIRRSASEMQKQIIPLNNDSLIEDFAKAQEDYLRRERGILAPDPRLDDFSQKGNVSSLRKRKLGILHSDPAEILKYREIESGKDNGQKKSWFSWITFSRTKEKIDEPSPDVPVSAKRGKQSPPSSLAGCSTEKVSFMEFLKTLREIVAEFKEYVAQNPRETRALRRQRNCCIGELVLIMIYCGLGAFVFRFTEGAFETFYKCGVKRVKRDFLDNLWNYSHNMKEEDWKSMARRKLMEFEEQLHNAHEAGVRSYSGQRSWSFLNAIIYCLTVITTIGYGHISPRTLTGQAITIVYALFGIPMFLIILADFGKLFTRGMKFLWAFVRRLYYTGSCRKVRRTAPVQEVMKGVQLVYDFATFRRPSQMNPEEVEEIQRQQTILNLDGNMPQPDTPGTPAMSHFAIDDEFNLPISIAIFILLGYIIIGAVVYWKLEGWNFFESFYFVFISMSTIGFGDFVPQEPMHTMFLIVYLVFGLALTSMCINVVQVMLSDTFKQASQKLSAHIGFEIPAEDEAEDVQIEGDMVELGGVHVTVKEAESQEKIAPKAKQEDIDL